MHTIHIKYNYLCHTSAFMMLVKVLDIDDYKNYNFL